MHILYEAQHIIKSSKLNSKVPDSYKFSKQYNEAAREALRHDKLGELDILRCFEHIFNTQITGMLNISNVCFPNPKFKIPQSGTCLQNTRESEEKDFVDDSKYPSMTVKLPSSDCSRNFCNWVEGLGEIVVAMKLLEDDMGMQVLFSSFPLYSGYGLLVSKQVFKYTKNTHAKTHSNYTVDIVQIWGLQ
ncbi:hypothetical protein POM88_047449 [Heracleum sosnowskyi]|uniref:Uncharacterized protein n=1 Tax=Heracleum sosnowskyi TaxID=360622 RepID=A0AAD8GUC8_9APIA|nr:hypothetical protein POM88_047449 [Heracleum sosnowskyi]